MDQETWRFINTFAPWFSAAGTTASVIVALYLARRGARVTLRVRAAVYKVVGQGMPVASGQEFLEIRATNVGMRETKIQGIMWRAGIIRKKRYVQIPPDSPLSTRLPARLTYGDEACFLFPLDDLRKTPDPVGEAVRSARWPWLALRWVRAGVYTTTGDEHLGPVDRSAWSEILHRESKQSA